MAQARTRNERRKKGKDGWWLLWSMKTGLLLAVLASAEIERDELAFASEKLWGHELLDDIHVGNLGTRLSLRTECAYEIIDRRDSSVLFESLPIGFLKNGKWMSQQNGGLVCVEATQSDPMEWEMRWRFNDEVGEAIITRGTTHTDLGYVEFSYEMLRDLPIGGSLNDIGNLSGTFPGFRTKLNRFATMSWEGSFVQPRRGCSSGTQGGPCVFYDRTNPTLGYAVVFSASNHFPMTSRATSKAEQAWIGGMPASMSMLPRGFVHSFLAVGALNREHGGVTAAVHAWGRVLQNKYKTSRVADVTIRKIGYQTDNGAQYCFCQSDCDAKLLAIQHELKKKNVNLGYLSYQNAWWPSSGSAPWCVTDWTWNKRKVPMGVPAFTKRLGLPIQLYGPYLCTNTPYETNFSMEQSNTTLPGCEVFKFKQPRAESSREFFDWLFELGMRFGMVNFEIDFVNQNLNCVDRYFLEWDVAEKFLDGMVSSAMRRNLSMQWCYATPNALMQAVRYPQVTNFRASFDYYYGRSWDIGTSSLMMSALNIAPSKDTFWSSDNGNVSIALGGCDGKRGCPEDHDDEGSKLHTILALMSRGPVGFSDAIGMSNATRLLQTCRHDGVLLQPSRPITTMDKFSPFLVEESHEYGPHVLSTYSGPSYDVIWSHYILVHHVDTLGAKTMLEISLQDLWPRYKATPEQVVIREFHSRPWENIQVVSLENCSKTILSLAGENFTHVSSRFTPFLFQVVPVCVANGFALLGETSKYVSLSTDRFAQIRCHDKNKLFSFTLHGSPGESIQISAIEAATKRIVSHTYILDSDQMPIAYFHHEI